MTACEREFLETAEEIPPWELTDQELAYLHYLQRKRFTEEMEGNK